LWFGERRGAGLDQLGARPRRPLRRRRGETWSSPASAPLTSSTATANTPVPSHEIARRPPARPRPPAPPTPASSPPTYSAATASITAAPIAEIEVLADLVDVGELAAYQLDRDRQRHGNVIAELGRDRVAAPPVAAPSARSQACHKACETRRRVEMS
jgi:hypothetical protein